MSINAIRKISPLFLLLFLMSCQDSGKTTVSPTDPASEVSIQTESTENAAAIESDQDVKEVQEAVPLPAVVLRDDAKVWGNESGVLSDKALASLDMGTKLTYLGKDEKLSSGSKSYPYSEVKLEDGTIGWISTVRLAKNAVPAVVVEDSGLYSKPLVTSPINRTVPAGQIVAVSLEKGNINSYAEISFSYYNGSTLSNPETRYIRSENLSASSNDMEVAKLVLKAFRNPDLSKDFFNLAFSLGSIFETSGTFQGSPQVYKDTDLGSESLTTTNEIKLLAVNPLDQGEAMPWYLGQIGGNELVWVYADSVVITPALHEKLSDRPSLKDNTTYRGDGVQSMNLYPGLSLRKMVTDDQGKESLIGYSSLEMGEVVYAGSREFQFDNIDFIYVDFPNGDSGWSSKNYIAENAKPAVVTEEGIPVFKEPKLTALSSIKLQKYQVIAVHNDDVSGFLKISYRSREDESLHREVFIQSNNASFSYKENDVHAALLLEKLLKATDPEVQDLFLEKAASIPSFLRADLDDLYYRDKIDGIEQETIEADA